MDALLNVFACRKGSVHEEAMLAVVRLPLRAALPRPLRLRQLWRAGPAPAHRALPRAPLDMCAPPLRPAWRVQGALTYACGRQFSKYMERFYPVLQTGLAQHQVRRRRRCGTVCVSALCVCWACAAARNGGAVVLTSCCAPWPHACLACRSGRSARSPWACWGMCAVPSKTRWGRRGGCGGVAAVAAGRGAAGCSPHLLPARARRLGPSPFALLNLCPPRPTP